MTAKFQINLSDMEYIPVGETTRIGIQSNARIPVATIVDDSARALVSDGRLVLATPNSVN